ncbi:MAG: CBS domain-containing protein [Hyphomicrobium sp.]|nr:CBS domain-containing protein [Hyphomicrobium sp.]
MIVQDILTAKGSNVKSVNPSDTLQSLSRRLLEEKIGAMVVLEDGSKLCGIISERDVVRGVALHGIEALGRPVSAFMTRDVVTCSPKDSLFGVAKLMTSRRIRHLPVSENGKMAGMISIGDVLNHRLEELQLEANVLRDYSIALK